MNKEEGKEKSEEATPEEENVIIQIVKTRKKDIWQAFPQTTFS